MSIRSLPDRKTQISDFYITTLIMGFWDFVEAATPWSTVEAEAPAKEEEVCTLLFPFSAAGMGDWVGRGGAKGWMRREEGRNDV